jgi:hypothetical protein
MPILIKNMLDFKSVKAIFGKFMDRQQKRKAIIHHIIINGAKKGNMDGMEGSISIIITVLWVDRTLRPRTLRPLMDFCYKTDKSDGILDATG